MRAFFARVIPSGGLCVLVLRYYGFVVLRCSVCHVPGKPGLLQSVMSEMKDWWVTLTECGSGWRAVPCRVLWGSGGCNWAGAVGYI